MSLLGLSIPLTELGFVSGQMIAGPPRKKRDVAEEVFVAARR